MAQLVNKAKDFVADKVANVQKPEADLTDLSVKHLSRDSASFSGQLNVYNPYSHGIPICEISYSFRSAGREIVSGTMPDPGSLKGKETTRMEIPLKVPYDFLISIMKDARRDWDIDYELRVGLTVDLPIIGNFTIPVSKKGELKLPTLSDVF
ncbi:Late embryogenesis abundant protein Lea14-A [Ananas comosus]|uniref:Late embryogenesis abundant protein Lea14-A n=1 Tax=Ananas comosus TaxID=4615 RepID=A0A199VTJ3_ANACO|nr:Late embryogenesis abundant protein Lea14-A [Ananas comosus]